MRPGTAGAWLAVALAAGCARPAPFMDPIPSKQSLREVADARRRFEQAVARSDRAALVDLLSEDFLHISTAGEVQDKAAFINGILSRGPRNGDAVDELRTRLFASTAVVTGRRGPRDRAKRGADTARFGMVLVQDDGRWRVASMHWTRVAPP